MRIWLLVALTLLPGRAHAESAHSPRLAALAKKVAAHEAGAENAFWRQLATEGAPLVESADDPGQRLVSFVWRGTAATRRVQLLGPVVPTQPEAELTRVPGTNTFVTTLALPDTGRFTYSFIVDGNGTLEEPSRFHHDPFNRHQFDPTQSLLELARAPKQPSMVPHAGTPAGTLWRHLIRGTTQQRQLLVYTPAGYSAKGAPYPLLVAFDGEAATFLTPTPLILDELIAAKRIPPLVALFVGSGNRVSDLAPNDAFADFVALDLVPWVRAHYHATSDPRQTVVSGISFGGLASMFAAFRHPEIYGNVLSQSGSFWWGPANAEPEQTARDFVAAARLPLRFWMEVGSFEAGNPRPETTQIAANRHLRDVLRARGYDLTYREFAGNHSYACWRGTFADGLTALFGTPSKLAPARRPKLAARPPLDVTPAQRLSSPRLVRAALLDGGDAAVTEAGRLSSAGSDGYLLDEDEINTAGCLLMTLDHPNESLGLLRWNTERFPQSANTWDSLAWAYYFLGERAHAIENLKQDLRLDPKNSHAAQLLEELTTTLP